MHAAARQRRRERHRLRVAYVYRYFESSGSIPSLYVRNAERLALDEDVTLFCSARRRQPTAAPLRFASVEPLVRGDGRIRYAAECCTFAIRAAAALAATRHLFDVVHSDGFATTSADLVTVHAVRAAEVTHYFSHVEPRARLRRRLSPVLLRPQNAVVMEIERRLLRRRPSPLCICPSRRIADDVERSHGLPADMIEVVPYGIDTRAFSVDGGMRSARRRELGLPSGALLLLFVGDDFERKGLAKLVAGVGRSGVAAHVCVVGGGDPRPYRALAAGVGVGDRVHFVGRRPPAEMASWYAAADAVVLPTRQDAWALTVVEAQAAGRVPVVSAHAGSREAIDDGVTGFVLDGGGRPEEIAALLDGPLGRPDVRAAIAARGPGAAARYDHERTYRSFRAAHHRADALRAERVASRRGPARVGADGA